MSLALPFVSESAPSAERCIAALVACRGNTKLAGERLGIDELTLQLQIAEDPNNIDILAQQMRVHTMLQTFELLGKSLLLMSASLTDLDSYDLSKHTMNMLTIMERLTNNQTQTQNVNINDTLLRSLPTEVREAVRVFIDSENK